MLIIALLNNFTYTHSNIYVYADRNTLQFLHRCDSNIATYQSNGRKFPPFYYTKINKKKCYKTFVFKEKDFE